MPGFSKSSHFVTTKLVGSNNTEHSFYIDERYDLSRGKILGSGSFGVVCSAIDLVRQERVAIKKVLAYCGDEWDARHALREIRLMRLLTPHPNFVTLLALSTNPRGGEMYLVMELLETDLHRIIRSNQPLSESHCKCIMKQLVEAVKAMHAVNVFHRDLKPGNLLVTKDCHLRVTDFGLARYMHNSTLEGRNDANPITKTVVTTLYRCPELLLSPDDMPYTAAIDMWSVGCIHAELLLRRPVFPGKNEMTTVQKIFEIFGYRGGENFGFPLSSDAHHFLSSKCRFPSQTWPQVLPSASEEALEVIEGLLRINPNHRLSAVDALALPFFSDAEVFYDYSVQYVHPPPFSYFSFEERNMTVVELSRLIQEEVQALPMSGYNYADLEAGRAAWKEGTLKTTPRSPSPTANLVGVQQPTQQQQQQQQQQPPPQAGRNLRQQQAHSNNSSANNMQEESSKRSVSSSAIGSDGVLSQEKTAPRAIGAAGGGGGGGGGGTRRGENPFANNKPTVRRNSKEDMLAPMSAASTQQQTAKEALSAESPVPPPATATAASASVVTSETASTHSQRSQGGGETKPTTNKNQPSTTISTTTTRVTNGTFWSRLFLCGGGSSQVKTQTTTVTTSSSS